MTSKVIRTIIRALLTLFAWLAAGYVLGRFEYFRSFGAIDHPAGMMPVVLAITAAGGLSALLWMKHRRRFLPVAVALALLVVLSAALFPTALRNNWRPNLIIPEGAEAGPDLGAYVPFSENSKTAKLGEEPALKLSADRPVLDGATALYPLYAALAEAVYDRETFSPEEVLCTSTRGAYEALIAGRRDIIFVAGASESQLAAARAAGADLRFTPIGREAFVFLVARDNPVDGLSLRQVRDIYSGKTARWATLGWAEGGGIIAFQRPEGSGSQTGLQNLMGELPIRAPQPLPAAELIGTNSLMRQISAEWRGVRPVLGYSYRYYAATMYANPEAKMLEIDGRAPSVANIQNGSYPLSADFYAVTNGEPRGNSKRFIDWILSPQGRAIVEKTGYVPIQQPNFSPRPGGAMRRRSDG